MKAHIWWSIYVRAANLRKLKQEHIPPIEAALENMEFDWQILKEEDAQGQRLFRLVTYQNFEIERVEELVIPLLRRAYKLSPSWTITGLEDLAAGELQGIIGSCNKPIQSNKPPALESLVFEAEPGRILGLNPDGGWQVTDELESGDNVKPWQIRRPLPPG